MQAIELKVCSFFACVLLAAICDEAVGVTDFRADLQEAEWPVKP